MNQEDRETLITVIAFALGFIGGGLVMLTILT